MWKVMTFNSIAAEEEGGGGSVRDDKEIEIVLGQHPNLFHTQKKRDRLVAMQASKEKQIVFEFWWNEKQQTKKERDSGEPQEKRERM
jgi:hypothetical protein